METLGIKTTFLTSGVSFEVRQNEAGDLFVSLYGGSLQPILDAHELTSLDLVSTVSDVQRLGRLCDLAARLKMTIS